MKYLFKSLIILLLFASGCKKDNSTGGTNTAKTYLVSKVTYTIPPGGSGFTSTEEYYYDSQNRVTEFNTGNKIYKYTYDADNNLATVTTYNNAGVLWSTDSYTYSGSTVTAQSVYSDGSIAGSYSFTLNAQNEVASLSADVQSYTYDSRGNALSYAAHGTQTQSDFYTYDNHKNPLSMIGARNLHLEYLAIGDPLTTVNNIITENAQREAFTYIYNDAGFPVSATVTNRLSTQGTDITYEYIVK